MTTVSEELKSLQDEYARLSLDEDNRVKMEIIKQQIKLLRQKTRPIDNSLGGQIKRWLVVHGLRRTFYCVIGGFAIMDIGLFLSSSLYALGFLIIGYGIYNIPLVKNMFREEKPKMEIHSK